MRMILVGLVGMIAFCVMGCSSGLHVRCACGKKANAIGTMLENRSSYAAVPCPEDIKSDPMIVMSNTITGQCMRAFAYPVRRISYICGNRHQTLFDVQVEKK